MSKFFQLFFENTRLYHLARNWNKRRKQDKKFVKWICEGKPIPLPHKEKQNVLRKYAQEYNLRVFVETGTFEGDMVEAMKNFFDKIFIQKIALDKLRPAIDCPFIASLQTIHDYHFMTQINKFFSGNRTDIAGAAGN